MKYSPESEFGEGAHAAPPARRYLTNRVRGASDEPLTATVPAIRGLKTAGEVVIETAPFGSRNVTVRAKGVETSDVPSASHMQNRKLPASCQVTATAVRKLPFTLT
jgi:hypothetical protein